MFFLAYRKSWTLNAWSGRLDAWTLDVWTLGLWTSGRLDSGRLEAWTLDDWTPDDWTLGLCTDVFSIFTTTVEYLNFNEHCHLLQIFTGLNTEKNFILY